MAHPTAHFEHPHKPKLRKLQIHALKEIFHFGTSFSTNNSATAAQYRLYENEQKINKSLRSLDILEHAAYILNDVPYDEFNSRFWTTNHDGLTGTSRAFIEIMRYTLCSFHLICRTTPKYMNNHEKPYSIENIIPSLLALARNTGFIEFKRCETGFHSIKSLNLAEYDDDLCGAPPSKYIDPLGALTTQKNMGLVIFESSKKYILNYFILFIHAFYVSQWSLEGAHDSYYQRFIKDPRV
ncbi:hypothetical protein RMATCC62417_10903 [Rhizopus microsporus]|nr:hypothetical protein RMATCC62417_10903 [Rhizopus microsporus]